MSNQLLSTQTFAQLCHTTKDTLLHYDHIGLLKPAMVDERCYRYYDPSQFYDFISVHSLQHLGMSLNEIKNMDSQNMETYVHTIDHLIETSEKQIEEYQLICRHLKSEKRFANRILRNGFHHPFLENRSEEYLACFEETADLDYQRESNYIYEFYQRRNLAADLSFNGIFRYEDFSMGKVDHFQFAQRLVRSAPDQKIHVKPAGLYMVLIGYAPWEHFDENIHALQEGLREMNVKPCGDVYFYTPITLIHSRLDTRKYNEISVPCIPKANVK